MKKHTAKTKAYRFGLYAEILAAMYLMLRGYRIVAWRYKTKVGEVDLIACRKKTLVFVEVKARQELSTALESVSPQMQRRIAAAANSFLIKTPRFQGHEMRFDVVAVSAPFSVLHLDNAWFSTT